MHKEGVIEMLFRLHHTENEAIVDLLLEKGRCKCSGRDFWIGNEWSACKLSL